MQRRKLLKTTGIGLVTTGTFVGQSLGSTQRDDPKSIKEDMIEATKTQRDEGEKAADDVLEDNGYRTSRKNYKVKNIKLGQGTNGEDLDIEEEDQEDGIGIESIEDPDDGGIGLIMRGTTRDSSDIYTFQLQYDYHFEFYRHADPNGGCTIEDISYGVDPKDGVGLFYKNPESYWKLATDNVQDDIITIGNTEFSSDASSYTDGKIGFRADDKELYKSWLSSFSDYPCVDEGRYINQKFGGTSAVMLKPLGDYSETQRAVYMRYTHAHDSFAISPSLSLGIPPSVSIEGYNSVDQTEIAEKPDGDVLVIRQEDI
ncbi:hypothetical protein [Natrinema salifodinae]|uniref:Uncharacterized protein n=1 Tax=Natrinema salifodinae TaxID=1202768 RepID=A0A1I0N9Z5_9EURY|nr:hypothetical protein [Natrinema salifodinae]SEV97711.1 hypothetical protein SAMN05216285_1466 [Natrinema salifodinae]